MKSRLLLLIGALSVASVMASDRPNVVLIFADDLGYGDVGCYGATKLKTPNIDRLAREGRRFTDAHSASAVCTPSRYALVTGRYPFRIGITRPVFLKTGLIIDTERTTVADVMKRAGYATACIGKWHLGFGKKTPDWNGDLKPGPLELGFDYYYGVPVVNSHPPFVYVENHRVVGLMPDDPFVYGKKAKTREFFEKMGTNQIGGADAAHALYDDEAVGTRMAEKSVEWIKANTRLRQGSGGQASAPFFLYLATTNIHHPFTPAPRFQGTSECGPYGDFVHELDWIVGEVMETLESEGLAENTLVIFTSDNGGMFNVGGQNAWEDGHRLNGDLLGFKFGAWEGGHRVPFIARWPGKIPANTASDQLISNIDLLATMAAIVEEPLGVDEGPDSFNILPALTASPKKPIRDHLVLAASKGTHVAMRSGKWVYIGARGSGGFTAAKRGAHAFGGPAAITWAGYTNSDIEGEKIKADAPKAQLYDLESDLSQTRNLYREKPEVVRELVQKLDAVKAAPATRPGAHAKPKASAKESAPNFIIIFTDDQGYEDLGCFGSKTIKTPHLDKMAAEGMKLTSFYAQPVCGVSRAALMTGSYPIRVGEPENIKRLHTVPHPEEVTIAEVLKGAGYATALLGKWHLTEKKKGDPGGYDQTTMPNAQGFDYFYGTPLYNGFTVFVDDTKFRSPIYRNQEVVVEKVESWDHITADYTKEAIAWIEKHADPSSGSREPQPFFLYLAHNLPHIPVGASEEFKGKSKYGPYGDTIEEIDWSCGEIFAALKRLGIDEETLVIFTSDNGPWVETTRAMKPGGKKFIPRDHSGSAAPLRGWKMSAWDGGCRVPCIVRWPGKVPVGKVSDEILSTMDLLPTFAALAGAELPKHPIDGKDASEFLTGKADTSPREDYFYYTGCLLTGVRSGKWKLVLPRVENPPGTGWWGRMIESVADVQLFNLDEDPGETTNRAAEHPGIVKDLRARIGRAREELGDIDRTGTGARSFDEGPRRLQVRVRK